MNETEREINRLKGKYAPVTKKRETEWQREKITHIFNTNLELFGKVMLIKNMEARKYALRDREKATQRERNHERKREKSDTNPDLFDKVILIK